MLESKGDSILSEYSTQGRLSRGINLKTKGKIMVRANANKTCADRLDFMRISKCLGRKKCPNAKALWQMH